MRKDLKFKRTKLPFVPRLIRVFAVPMKKAWVLSYPLSAQRRLGLDWAESQADLSLRWAHMPFVGFVVRWVKYFLICAFKELRTSLSPLHTLGYQSESTIYSGVSVWVHYMLWGISLSPLHTLGYQSESTAYSGVSVWVHCMLWGISLSPLYTLGYQSESTAYSGVSVHCILWGISLSPLHTLGYQSESTTYSGVSVWAHYILWGISLSPLHTLSTGVSVWVHYILWGISLSPLYTLGY